MDTKTEVVYTNTLEHKKSYIGRTLKHRKSLFLRCGIIVCSLLTFYVLLTFYNELRQASQLLLEIKKHSVVLNTNNTSEWQENVKADKIKATSNSETEFDNNIFDRILDFAKAQNDSQFSEDDLGQAIRRRFQENVYMIRKRFYESHQSKRLQTSAVQENTQDVQKNTQDVQKNTQDVQKNTQDVQKNTQDVQKNTQDVQKNTEGVNDSTKALEENAQYSSNFDGRISQISDIEKPELLQDIGENPRISREIDAGDTSTRRGTHEPRANVIIVAYHRSGSSFLGEMFNRDPKAFYLFEPLHTIDSFLDARRRFPVLHDTLVRNLLDNIFKCEFSKHPLFVNTLTSSAFRLKSEVLTSGGLCDPRVNAYKMHLCKRINATILTKLCSSRPHTVIKTIRMAQWKNLDFLTDSLHTSFKVIHLVRDPRGIITSRVSWLLQRVQRNENSTSGKYIAVHSAITKYVQIMSAILCKQMANDINDWTKRAKIGRPYAMVRYEDVSRQPLTVYKEISEFVGVAQSESVIGWLENNTKSSDLDYYSTTRNSSAVPHMWRRSLTMRLVNVIQNSCAQVMSILGYKMVYSERELRDMRVPLVVDWDNKGFLRTKPFIGNNVTN